LKGRRWNDNDLLQPALCKSERRLQNIRKEWLRSGEKEERNTKQISWMALVVGEEAIQKESCIMGHRSTDSRNNCSTVTLQVIICLNKGRR
jgi:hypothetical protein